MDTDLFWFYDLLLVGIVLGCIYLGVQKGFLRMLVSFVGNILAVMISAFVSSAGADWLYVNYAGPAIREGVETRVSTLGAEATVGELLAAATKSFPSTIREAMRKFAQESTEVMSSLTEALGQTTGELAGTAAEAVVQPIIHFLIQTVLFLVLLGILSFVIARIADLFGGLKHVPIVGPVNTLLGGAFGLLQAAVVVLLIVLLLRVLIVVTGGQLMFINEATIDRTYVFRYFYAYDLFALLS